MFIYVSTISAGHKSSLNYFEDDECAWLYSHVTFFVFSITLGDGSYFWHG